MNANVLSKLEKDSKFQKENLPRSFWFKQPSIYVPAAILFAGLAGLLSLVHRDMLFSLMAIPFACLLIVGAIQLKMTKRYITKNILKKDGIFKVCLSRIIENKNGLFFVIINISDKRHDKHYIDSIQKKVMEYSSHNDYLSEILGKLKKGMVRIDREIAGNDDTYAKSFYKKDVLMHYPDSDTGSYIPVLFFYRKATLIKRKYLNVK